MVTTFHSREVRSSTFCNSVVENIPLSKYLLACVGMYPSYIAGLHSTYYVVTLRISQLCVAHTDSPILDKLYRRFSIFEVGAFGFRMSEADEYASFPDYSLYDITYEGASVRFLFPLSTPLCVAYPNLALI